MAVLLLFAFISGLITIFAPCIWPLLPIILSSSSTGGKAKPLGITLGIMASFTLFTLTISYIVKIIPFDPNILRLFAVVVIGFLGLTLVIPKLNELVEGYVSKLSSKMGPTNTAKNGFGGGFITGFSLGIVWSPCAGPILATIATLSATSSVNFGVILVTLTYVLGVGIPLFLFATIGNNIFSQSRKLNKYTGKIQQVFGVIMVLTAIAIFTNYDKTLQAKLLDQFPAYSHFITEFESNEAVKKQLDDLKGNKDMPVKGVGKASTIGTDPNAANLQNYGPAPEFTGITKWLNTEKPLTMAELKGKVVLIDFWTYTCINCIRTLPYVTGWYEKYKNDNFVIIGVHSPEFEFEKKTENVEDANKRFNITYPVAQDNDFGTWKAYDNQYWPAKYLIDAKGNIRYFHFGEGDYDKTEEAIQELLKEAGKEVSKDINNPMYNIESRTPEIYLGYARMEYFASPEGIKENVETTYTVPESLPDNEFAYGGVWTIGDEKSMPKATGVLVQKFESKNVFLVMNPKQGTTGQVRVRLDGQVVTAKTGAGKDVIDGVVTVDTDRLYELITLPSAGKHVLQLEFLDGNTEIFAFTFG